MDLGDLNSYFHSAIGFSTEYDKTEKETCFLQLSDSIVQET